MRNRVYTIPVMMWEMEIGKRLAAKRMRDAADLRKNTRFIWEQHIIRYTWYGRKARIIIIIIIIIIIVIIII